MPKLLPLMACDPKTDAVLAIEYCVGRENADASLIDMAGVVGRRKFISWASITRDVLPGIEQMLRRT